MRDRVAMDPDEYLALLPHVVVQKWVVRCAGCRRQGYQPEMPSGAKFAVGIKRTLEPMQVDALGHCESCSHAAMQ